MRICYKCKNNKQLLEFSKKKTGLNTWCKTCISTYRNSFYKRHPERYKKLRKELSMSGKQKSYALLTNYGINLDQFNEMVKSQSGKCLICRQTDKLCVDHDHDSGIVRGLLCTKCNKGLGMFHDDTSRLEEAIRYIEAGKKLINK